MFFVLCLICAIFIFTFLSIGYDLTNFAALVMLIVSSLLIGYIVCAWRNHPSPIKVTEEKVVILNNKAITETCLELNKEIGKNLTGGQVVYRIEQLPYWHRGLYWFSENPTSYSLENPIKESQ